MPFGKTLCGVSLSYGWKTDSPQLLDELDTQNPQLFSKKKDKFLVMRPCSEPTSVVAQYEASAAWRSGSERRFYDDHDRKVNGSTPNSVSLLRSWIRCFTMIISAWWSLAISKLKKSEETQPENLETKATPKPVWIRPTHSASAAFS